MSYEDFKLEAFFDTDTNTWVVNGDELVETEEELRDSYDRYVETEIRVQAAEHQDQIEEGLGTTAQESIVNFANGRVDRWYPQTTADNLTYCVSKQKLRHQLHSRCQCSGRGGGRLESLGQAAFRPRLQQGHGL